MGVKVNSVNAPKWPVKANYVNHGGERFIEPGELHHENADGFACNETWTVKIFVKVDGHWRFVGDRTFNGIDAHGRDFQCDGKLGIFFLDWRPNWT